jgi:C4-dicarboxylate-specific signal transduction histidine kinase
MQPATLARVTLAVLSVVTVFLLDTFTLMGTAIAVLYVMPLLFIGGDLSRLRIAPWSAVCAALTLASYAINHGLNADPSPMLRMGISLAANVVTTLLILRAKAMVATLHESQDRYRTIFDSLAVGIWEHDFRPVQAAIDDLRAAGVQDLKRYLEDNPDVVSATRRLVRITDVNETALRLMKVKSKEDFFSHLSEFLPETDDSFAECILAIDERRPLFQAETRVTARDGEEFDVIVAIGFHGTGRLDRVPASILNITQSRRMEAVIVQTRDQLERAQRAAAMGQLTASIAHEINQPLSAIRSFADAACRWLRRPVPNVAEADLALQSVVEAVQHANNVIRGVHALTGKARMDINRAALDPLLRDCAVLMQREVSNHKARMVLRLDAGGVDVDVDRVLIQQVLANLIANALQAMEDTPECSRLVTITSRIAGQSVEVSVSDTGPGWPSNGADLAFEAFQTTKRDGMGLGLSISRSAIQAHQGTIAIGTIPGSGTIPGGGACVIFTLPRADAAQAEEPRPLMQAHS